MLRSKDLAGSNSNKVDVLILTHPDADHHNQVVKFFENHLLALDIIDPSSGGILKKAGEAMALIGIDRILISGAFEQKTGRRGIAPPLKDGPPLENYDQDCLNTIVYDGYFSTSKIEEVTINDTDDNKNIVKTWNKQNRFNSIVEKRAPAAEVKVTGKRYYVLQGTIESVAWSVSIIAGNVPKANDVTDLASPDNARSLITLFQIGTNRALLMGDATFSTEKFLLAHHSDLLKGVELAAVGHHGSANASGQKFVCDHLKPNHAVVSVGFFERQYGLPYYDGTLQNWIEHMYGQTLRIDQHDIDYWTRDKQIVNPDAMVHAGVQLIEADIDELHANWQKEKSRYGDINRHDAACWFLENPLVGAWATLKGVDDARCLFREMTDLPLTQTSQRTQIYTLTGSARAEEKVHWVSSL